jgi:probable blue pigment (indigoidine) exporter
MATSAAVLLLLAWPLLSERPAAVSVAGALTGFTGVCVLLLNGGGVDPAGAGASLAAMLMSSLGYILTKRWAGGQSVMAVTAWQLIAGGVLVVPAAALVEGAPPQLTGCSPA